MAIISNAVTIADAGAFSVNLGSLTHIKTLTASSDSTISFVDGTSDVVLDDTYPIYLFKIINIHPSATQDFRFQGNAAGGSGFNETITSTHFRSYNNEAGDTTTLAYGSSYDLAQGTGVQILFNGVGADNDQSASGTLYLFNPSSTTFVKHWIWQGTQYQSSDYNIVHYAAGYFNTTSAIDEIQFSPSTGNIDVGTFKLYGIKDS
jgi:hypothetical protein